MIYSFLFATSDRKGADDAHEPRCRLNCRRLLRFLTGAARFEPLSLPADLLGTIADPLSSAADALVLSETSQLAIETLLPAAANLLSAAADVLRVAATRLALGEGVN